MEQSKQPIRRSVSLQPLSREHHDGLMLCLKIRQGLKAAIDPLRILKYLVWFAQEHLEPHFLAEEKYLLPLLSPDDPLVARTLSEHAQLRSYFFSETLSADELARFANLLDDHIRFEERVLFQALQERVAEDLLLAAMQRHEEQSSCQVWQDPYWQENNH